MIEGQIPQHQHVAYGRVHQTEHFNLLVKRCHICNEFMGCETAIRQDVQPEAIPETENKDVK